MTVINILDRHPQVKIAVSHVDSVNPNLLEGAYWRDEVIKSLATQYHTDGKYKGLATPAALDWAEMMMDEYDNDNG
jgi:hypothetical protein